MIPSTQTQFDYGMPVPENEGIPEPQDVEAEDVRKLNALGVTDAWLERAAPHLKGKVRTVAA